MSVRSTLRPEVQVPQLLLATVAAVVFHLVVGLGFWGATTLMELLKEEDLLCFWPLDTIFCPVVEEREVIEISMVVLPKSDMPHKAMKTPSVAADRSPEPELVKAPPDKSSSDLTHKSEDAPKKPTAEVKQDSPAVADLVAEMRRKAALDAVEGSRDQDATDPDSTSTERIGTGPANPSADPRWGRFAAQVNEAFYPNLHVLPTLKTAELECKIEVWYEPDTGAVTRWEWMAKSGNPSFDGSCQRAVEATQKIPAPPEWMRPSLKDFSWAIRLVSNR